MTDPAPPWRADVPHNSLPGLPPGVDLESKAVLKACITARAALAELKQAAELIPNQTMLINTIPLLEAKDSSVTSVKVQGSTAADTPHSFRAVMRTAPSAAWDEAQTR